MLLGPFSSVLIYVIVKAIDLRLELIVLIELADDENKPLALTCRQYK